MKLASEIKAGKLNETSMSSLIDAKRRKFASPKEASELLSGKRLENRLF
jgi:hypothetical protein